MAAENDQKVTLGCGTLILIALIVLIFANAGNEEIQTELRQIRLEIGDLEDAVDSQRSAIEELRKTIQRAQEVRRPQEVGVPREAPPVE